jgi:predicted permease
MTFVQDLRFSARLWRKRPGFAVAIVLTIALGIGATTGIFSVIYGVLLRPLPYSEPERIVGVWQVGRQGNRMQTSDVNFEDWHQQNNCFSGLAQFAAGTTTVIGGSEPVRLVAAVVSEDFFHIFGVQPVIGRNFFRDEHMQGSGGAIIVSYGYWQRYLAGDPDLANKFLTVYNATRPIVGVMPAQFSFPIGSEIWVTRSARERLPSRTAHNWQAVGRLKPETTLEAAQSEMSGLGHRMKQQFGDEIWLTDIQLTPLLEQLVGRVRDPLLILLGATLILLLVACANVVNLLLAQAAARNRELAIRVAMGANRWRLVKQFLAEALLVSVLGGLLGVLIAIWGVRALMAIEPGNLPRSTEIGVNAPVLVFALAVSVIAAVVLGLVVSLRTASTDPQEALKEGGRSQSGGVLSRRFRNVLVVAQVAMTLVLLSGSGLLGRSFLKLLEVDPGFRTEGIVAMSLSQAYPRDASAAARLARLHDVLIERLKAIPGVTEVGGVDTAPLGSGGADGTFLIMNAQDEMKSMREFEVRMRDKERTGSAEFRVASTGYFQAMGIPLLRGRLFEDRDGIDSPHVAVISESLARTRWPNEEPIGKLIQFGNMDGDLRLFTIVGIVGDILERGVDRDARPTFYGYYRQRPGVTGSFNIMVRGIAPTATLVPAARQVLQELDPNVPPRFRTIEELMAASLADRRFNLLLLGVFSGTALILAMLGIYGVTSYTVAQRTAEVGIRMALGAQPRDVVKLILGQGAILVAGGIAIGLVGALLLTRVLRTYLFGISPTDPATWIVIGSILTVVALVACYIPARRATKVDALSALRA